jgi:hypothetical protein
MPLSKVGRVDESPGFGGENQLVILPQPVRCIISSSWRLRCALRALKVPAVRVMVRRLLAVFGSPSSRRPPLLVMVRRITHAPVSEVNVGPLEGQEFPLPHPGDNGRAAMPPLGRARARQE